MNEKNLVICDREFRYANSLGENISEHEELAVKVYTCTSLEKVLELSKDKRIHMFVVDEGYEYEERKQVAASQVFVLAKGTVKDLGEEEREVLKYQCADQIIREILETYVKKTQEDIVKNIKKKKAKLVAVYSPIHRIGKTQFAIALGKEWAKKEKVLYLNMEEYAGLDEGSGDEANLTDVLYYIKQGNFSMRLQAATQKMGELDYILPMPMYTDFREVSLEEWEELFQQILENTSYETVILDLGESIQGVFQILQICDQIYMPVLEDDISNRKIQKYEATLERLGLEKILAITCKFVAPENVEEYVKLRVREENESDRYG